MVKPSTELVSVAGLERRLVNNRMDLTVQRDGRLRMRETRDRQAVPNIWPTCLAVDDLPAHRYLLTAALLRAEFKVIPASNGYDGWQKARLHRPRLIVTDLDMPGWGGWQLIEAIRASPDPEVAQIPIIACSNTHDRLAIREAFDAGANCFHAKPIELNQLLARLLEIRRSAVPDNQPRGESRSSVNH